jgi:hypothetical protein
VVTNGVPQAVACAKASIERARSTEIRPKSSDTGRQTASSLRLRPTSASPSAPPTAGMWLSKLQSMATTL